MKNTQLHRAMRIALLLSAALLSFTMLFGCKKSDESANTTAPVTEAPKLTLDEDYKVPSFPSTGLYINYSPNSSVAGTIEGGGTHRVDGKPVKEVKAIPNLGYRFVKWSDGSTDPVRKNETATESKQIIAYFDYETLEMPILCIDTETGRDVESKTEYIGATLSIFNSDSEHFIESMDMQIRGRGNYTWNDLEKKSYKMKLSEKQSLLGLGEGKAKKWVLLANMCDQSMLRNYLSLNLAGSMPHIAWSPDSTSVEVYLNGEYRGVYLLCEEIDANANKVNVQEDLTGAGTDVDFLIELSGSAKDPSFHAAERTYQIHNDLSANEQEAKQQKSFITSYVISAWEAVKSGDETAVAEYIDIDSMVDAYLVEEITKNLDCGYDSFYLYRNVGGKLTFGPVWDFDNSLGNANEGTERYQYLYAAYNERFQNNPWFYTIMEQQWFRQRVLQRWDEIADLRSELSSIVLEAGKAEYKSYCRNFERWDLFGRSWNRETEQITSLMSYKEHYEFLAKWVDQRLDWLDEFYHGDEFIENWAGSAPGFHEPEEPDWPEWPEWPDWPDEPDDSEPPVIAEGIGNEAYQTLTEEHRQVAVEMESATSTIEGFYDEGVGNLFDGNIETKYCCDVNADYWNPVFEITFTLSDAQAISGYALVTANDTAENKGRNPVSWVLYGKDASGNYQQIDSATAREVGMGNYNFTGYGKILTDTTAYSEYKLVVTHEERTFQLGELYIYTK